MEPLEPAEAPSTNNNKQSQTLLGDPWKKIANSVPIYFSCFQQSYHYPFPQNPRSKILQRPSSSLLPFDRSQFYLSNQKALYTIDYSVPDLQLRGSLVEVASTTTIEEIKQMIRNARQVLNNCNFRLFLAEEFKPLFQSQTLFECISSQQKQQSQLFSASMIAQLEHSSNDSFSVNLKWARESIELGGLYPDDCIRRVKAMINSKLGVSIEEQRVLFLGNQLCEWSTLEQIGIVAGSRIDLVKRQYGGLPITVYMLSCKQIQLQVSKKQKIEEIKKRIQDLQDIEVEDQKLYYQGKQLLNPFTVEQYQIAGKNPSLILVKRLSQQNTIIVNFFRLPKNDTKNPSEKYEVQAEFNRSVEYFIQSFQQKYPFPVGTLRLLVDNNVIWSKHKHLKLSNLGISTFSQVTVFQQAYQDVVVAIYNERIYQYHYDLQTIQENDSYSKQWLLRKLQEDLKVPSHLIKLYKVQKHFRGNSLMTTPEHYSYGSNRVHSLCNHPALKGHSSVLNSMRPQTQVVQPKVCKNSDVFEVGVAHLTELKLLYKNEYKSVRIQGMYVRELQSQITESGLLPRKAGFSLVHKNQLMRSHLKLSEYGIHQHGCQVEVILNVEGGWLLHYNQIVQSNQNLNAKYLSQYFRVSSTLIASKYLRQPKLNLIQRCQELNLVVVLEMLPHILSVINSSLLQLHHVRQEQTRSYIKHFHKISRLLDSYSNKICYRFISGYHEAEYTFEKIYVWPEIWFAVAQANPAILQNGTLFVINMLSGRLIQHNQGQLILGMPYTYFEVVSVQTQIDIQLTKIVLRELPCPRGIPRALWLNMNPDEHFQCRFELENYENMDIMVAVSMQQALFALRQLSKIMNFRDVSANPKIIVGSPKSETSQIDVQTIRQEFPGLEVLKFGDKQKSNHQRRISTSSSRVDPRLKVIHNVDDLYSCFRKDSNREQKTKSVWKRLFS